jgi:hypothetical protein
MLDLLEKVAALILAVGTICGGFWAVQKIFLGFYDRVKKVDELVADNKKLKNTDIHLKRRIYQILELNKQALAQNDLKTDEVIERLAATQREVLKIAIKTGTTEPDFRRRN